MPSLPSVSTVVDLPAFELIFDGGIAGHVVRCDACEGTHHVGRRADGGGIFPSQCFDGPRSPYASGYRLNIIGTVKASDAVTPIAPFARRPPFWRQCDLHARRLRAHVAAAILGRSDADVIVTETIEGRSFRLAGPAWHFGREAGDDLLTLAGHLYGLRAGVAAVRVLEAATGLRLDARAFLEIAEAVEGFYSRGAPSGEGRRA